MTSTRSTIPAPPPSGVSSTTLPLSVVWSRGLSARSSWPASSALRTWRWPRNHSNHSGNSVTTSSCTEEPRVDVDPLGLDVHGADRVADHRHEQPGVELERLARRQRHEPHDDAELVRAVGHRAALEVLGEVLVLVER